MNDMAFMTHEEREAHLANCAIIEMHEPTINLSQGSWLRVARENVSATLMQIIENAPGNVRLTVKDTKTAASLRVKR